MSATPGPIEQERSQQIVEQVIRPTGLLDPEIIVKPTEGQIEDLLSEINMRTAKNQRVLVTTLTKKMAEDLTNYLKSFDVKVRYMHHDIDTIERMEIIRDLRLGEFDVLGNNVCRHRDTFNGKGYHRNGAPSCDTDEVQRRARHSSENYRQGYKRCNRDIHQGRGGIRGKAENKAFKAGNCKAHRKAHQGNERGGKAA